jgi:peptidoglycan hydrolase CwlO-like protein
MWDVIITAISTGSIGSLLTWLVSRRKRNNDFLGELQNSINVLTENYTKTLNELVTVKQQNAELLIQMSDLQHQVAKLKEENAKLICKINELNKLIKSTKE